MMPEGAIAETLRVVTRRVRHRNNASTPAVTPRTSKEQLRILEVIDDFGLFCERYVRIQDKTSGRTIPFNRYPCQRRVSRLLLAGKWPVCLKARQLGLTWLVAVYCAWRLITRPTFTACVLQQNREYARDFLKRVRFVHRNLPDFLRVPIIHDSRYELTLGHRPGEESELRVIVGGEGAGRSITADLIIFDEHARIPNAADAREACEPTVEVAGGQMVSLSSSAGSVGDFHDVWSNAPSNGYEPVFLRWDERPGRDEAWYERRRLQHESSPYFMAREYPSSAAEAFMRAEGRCFPKFEPDRHVRSLNEIGCESSRPDRYRAIDFGAVHPFVCLWLAYFPEAPSGLTFDVSCVNCIREFLSYRFERTAERPVKEHDHTCDALRYVVMHHGMEGHVHVYRELYIVNSVSMGRTDLDDVDDVHRLSGWERSPDCERTTYQPGPAAELYVDTVTDRSLSKTIELYCAKDLICQPYAKPQGLGVRDDVLEGIRRLNILLDGTRAIRKDVRPTEEQCREKTLLNPRRPPSAAAECNLQEAAFRDITRRRLQRVRDQRARRALGGRYRLFTSRSF